MSPSDLLRGTGLKVSTRQFRRYMACGVIPGIIRGKGGHFAVVGPVTQTRLSTIRKRVLKFRCKPGRKKLNYVPPVESKNRRLTDARFPGLNLHGIMIEFEWWMSRCDPLEKWSDDKKRDVLKEVLVAGAVASRLADDLNQKILHWDGSKKHFDTLRRR